jgi:hypothetical protein
MNTRSSKEYRYIFTTTWKQASTSHLFSRLTDNASCKLLIIFILSYLFVLPTYFLRISKTHNRTSLQVWMQIYCTFVLFVNQHFPGLPASGTHCITTDSQSASPSLRQAPIWDPRPIFPILSLIFFRQFRVCLCGAPSLTRSRVCTFQFLPGIASVAFLRSESHGIHEHSLLSLFLRFPQPGGPGSCIYFTPGTR